MALKSVLSTGSSWLENSNSADCLGWQRVRSTLRSPTYRKASNGSVTLALLQYSVGFTPFGVWGHSMQLSTESLLIILLVGAIAGWVAGQVVRGYGFGLLGNIAVGVVGALIGSWLLPQLGVFLGTGIVASIVNATLGAILLLLVLGLLRRRGGPFWRR